MTLIFSSPKNFSREREMLNTSKNNELDLKANKNIGEPN